MMRTTYALFFTLFIYLFFVQSYYAFHFFTDDAYISLRYAKHLSEGLGLVWNKGSAPIEGYTNFAWVLLAAFLFHFKLNVILSIKVISLSALLINTVLLFHISRFWLSRELSCLPSLLMLFHRGEIIWTFSGLETTVFQTCVLFSTFLFLKSVTEKKKAFLMGCGLILVIASLVRFEGPILMLSFILTLFLIEKYKIENQSFFVKAGYFLLPFALFYLPYFIWRWAYFGRLFPNTVYCKAFMTVVPGFLDMDYLLMVAPLMIFSVPVFIRRFDRRILALILPSLIYLVALINGEVVVGYFHRLFLPVFVLLLPLFVLGLSVIIDLPQKKITPEKKTVYVILTTCLLGFFLIPSYLPVTNYQRFVEHQALNMTQRQQIGAWLKEQVKKDEVVTVSDCGLIPFVYEGEVIDTYCLNNPKITRSPINLSYRRFTDEMMNHTRPRYIILSAVTQHHKAYSAPFDLAVLKRSEFQKDYQKIKRFMIGDDSNGYYYDIYRRKG